MLLKNCGWHIKNTIVWEKLDAAPRRTKNQWRPVHEHIIYAVLDKDLQYFDEDEIRVPYSPETAKRWGSGQKYGGQKSGVKGPAGQAFQKDSTFKLNPKGTLQRDVLRHSTSQSRDMHYATFPASLIETFVRAGSQPGDIILDPFCGSGTTGVVAIENGRRFVGSDIMQDYVDSALARLDTEGGLRG